MLKMRILSSLGSSAAAAVLVSSIIAGPAAAEQSPLGIWLDDKGRGAVEIAQCGPALCGKVVWVKFSKDKDGCGAKIMDGVKSAGNNTWDYGWIYSPDHGRRFDVALTPQGTDRLRVTGYAGIKLFSESRTWTLRPLTLTVKPCSVSSITSSSSFVIMFCTCATVIGPRCRSSLLSM